MATTSSHTTTTSQPWQYNNPKYFTVAGTGLRKQFDCLIEAEAFLRCWFEDNDITRVKAKKISPRKVVLMKGSRSEAERATKNDDAPWYYGTFELKLIAHL